MNQPFRVDPVKPPTKLPRWLAAVGALVKTVLRPKP